MTVLEIHHSPEEWADILYRSMRREELHELIKAIDSRAADWDFTLPLCEHFAEAQREFEAEEKVTDWKGTP